MVFDTSDVSLAHMFPFHDFLVNSTFICEWPLNQKNCDLIPHCFLQLSSFAALKKWVSSIDIQKFDILLCLGNKVDLLPGHPAHIEYKRRLLKNGESSVNTLDFSEYGISETEGSSLLGDDESSWEFRKSHLEWCLEHNIEYVEACASNIDFDKCMAL